jgi:hypothetical protein
MTVNGPSLSSQLAALAASLQPAALHSTASVPSAPAQASQSMKRSALSSVAAGAMLGLNTIATAAPAPAPTRVSNPYTSPAAETYTRAGIPAEKAAWIASLGADSWELRQPTRIDEVAFEQRALDSMIRSGMAKFPGFAEARANGTLKVQHAHEQPELGYRSFQLTLYKDGQEFGGVGFGTMNSDRWLELRQSGTFAATGSVAGNDYVATWPLAWDGGDERIPRHAA